MISRRTFLKGGIVLGGALMLDSLVLEPRNIELREVETAIRGLPPDFDGLRICQFTDVHHGLLIGRSYIDSVVDLARGLKPDLVVLTGDYIDESRKYAAPAAESLASIDCEFGTIAVLGNHDYFIGWQNSADVIRSQGVRLLMNEHVVLERGPSSLCVAGVRDYFEDVPDAARALAGVPRDMARILLCHHPDYAEFLPADERVDLVLSGHTHGGQVRVPFTRFAPVVPSHFGQKYSGGAVHINRPGRALGPDGRPCTKVYVSRGVGVALLPVRFNCPPELTLITLRSA